MIGIFFSLLPLVGYGTADYVVSKLSNDHNPAIVNLFMSVSSGVPLIILCLFFGAPEINLNSVSSFLSLSLIFCIAYIMLVKAFSSGVTGIISPISNSYAIVTLIIVVIFLGVETDVIQAFAVIIVVTGISLLSYEKSSIKGKIKIDKAITIAVLAMILFGIGFAGFDVVASQEWYQNMILFEASTIIISTLLVLFWPVKNKMDKTKKIFSFKFAYIGSIVMAVGSAGLFLAIANVDNISIPAAIAAASPLVTIWLARKYDKENLAMHQYIGAFVVVTGIITLSLTS